MSDRIHINTELIPPIEGRILGKTFCNIVEEFYKNPDNLAAFKQWQDKK
nr:hypothetical protein [Eubacteriales bacterium]